MFKFQMRGTCDKRYGLKMETMCRHFDVQSDRVPRNDIIRELLLQIISKLNIIKGEISNI